MSQELMIPDQREQNSSPNAWSSVVQTEVSAVNDDSQPTLCAKIARLFEERGLSLKDFAELAGLDRLTVRGILQGDSRRLHNATVGACARALGLTVHSLRNLSLEQLLRRIQLAKEKKGPEINGLQHLYEEATQPELLAWVEENPQKARQLTPEEWDELLSWQGPGGHLTKEGVDHIVDRIERKRRLAEKMANVARTQYLELLEEFVDFLDQKCHPLRDWK